MTHTKPFDKTGSDDTGQTLAASFEPFCSSDACADSTLCVVCKFVVTTHHNLILDNGKRSDSIGGAAHERSD